MYALHQFLSAQIKEKPGLCKDCNSSNEQYTRSFPDFGGNYAPQSSRTQLSTLLLSTVQAKNNTYGMVIHELNIEGRSPVVDTVNNLNHLLHSTYTEPRDDKSHTAT